MSRSAPRITAILSRAGGGMTFAELLKEMRVKPPSLSRTLRAMEQRRQIIRIDVEGRRRHSPRYT